MGTGGASGGSSAEGGPDGAGGGKTEGGSPDALDETSDAGIVDAGSDGPVAPPTLSATGFFKSIGADGGLVLGDGVRAYEPRYKLWSDGADKKRWVYLPPGTKIDNTDQDHWVLPVGAKFWKEFALNGKRIETRLVYHVGPGPNDYLYATYWWKTNDAGASPADAELVPPDRNVNNANGTDHDIPFEDGCRRCHDPLKEHVLGFSAFQLTPPPAGSDASLTGVTLKTLNDEGSLMVPTPNGFEMPGATAVIRDALGYLHANCGNCHNDTPGIAIPDPKLIFKVLVAQKTAQETGAYTTALNVVATKAEHAPDYTYRIYGGDPSKSSASYRMNQRSGIDGVADSAQMPPLATEHPDPTGIAAVNAWIMTLPPPPDR
jgi:hypothetical protein